ncbi:hypothetical protein AeMF1_019732 [Aphanomyces euteiches]|nr:hypothetical protein AeMF1_019732 [Aphanomyces euteiches]KAH9180942.1 hypothetical protein AeNC1_017080 [Aphanomyces euteiches]
MGLGKTAFSASAVIVALAIAYSVQTDSMRLQALKAKNAHASFPGQTALVVGGTSGIGEGIARRLAQAKFNVVIAGRNAARGDEIVKEMQSINPDGKYRFLSVDAQHLTNIQGLSSQVPPIDKLVLTQGIATIQGYTPTSEGIDQKLALHYYGRMAFIQEFLPVLRESQNSPRVLSVLSGGIHSPYSHIREDPELKENYSLKNAADAAGYYNDLMLDALSEKPENSGVAFAHSAPGFVATNWGTEMPWIIRMLLKPLKLFAKSKDDCGEFMADFLLDPEVTPGKLYVINQHGDPTNTTTAHTEEAKAFIYQHTIDRIAAAVKTN